MKELVKSIILMMLVLSSLLLTYLLWFGDKRLEITGADVYEPVYFEEPRPLEEVVVPRHILLFRDEAVLRFGYGEPVFTELWRATSAVLKEGPQGLPQPQTGEEPPAEGGPVLALDFDPPLPVGPGAPWLGQGEMRRLAGVVFEIRADQPRMVFQEAGREGRLWLPLTADQAALLEKACEQVPPESGIPYRRLQPGDLAEFNPVPELGGDIYVPDGEITLDDLVLKEQLPDLDLLLQSFFVDRSLVRVISERNGALIYTDGEKGLRIADGIDYSHPRLEDQPATLSYTGALQSAAKLLGYHGGWPPSLRLERLELAARGEGRGSIYRACWLVYYRGFPLLGEAKVRIDFNDRGMIAYQRRLYEPLYPAGSPFTVQGWDAALDKALHSLPGRAGEDAAIYLEDVVLGYLVDPEAFPLRGIPVWVFRLNGKNIAVGARDLRVWEEQTL